MGGGGSGHYTHYNFVLFVIPFSSSCFIFHEPCKSQLLKYKASVTEQPCRLATASQVTRNISSSKHMHPLLCMVAVYNQTQVLV